jgi:hypothetical protein
MACAAYTVTATLPDPGTLDEYVAWLAGGHVAAVLAAGALGAEIIVLDEGLRVETRYTFPDRASLDHYQAGPAVALRAEGWVKFGSRPGITFERRIGRVVRTIPERAGVVG